MADALSVAFAPGYYEATYNGNSLGLVEGPRRFRRRAAGEPIRADKYGDSVIDMIYRGGDQFLMMTFKEWTATVLSALWPWGADYGAMGDCGRAAVMQSLAKEILLQAVSTTPAYSVGPAVQRYYACILAEENDTEILFGNTQRDVPILFRCFPVSVSGTVRWFSLS